MNLFSLTSIVVILSTLGLGFFIFITNKNNKVASSYGALAIAAGIWGIGAFLFSTTSNKETALFGWRIAHIGIIFTPPLFFHFVCRLANLNKKRLLFISYLSGLLFLLLCFLDTKLFLGDIDFVFNSFYFLAWYKQKNIGYLLYYILFYHILLGYAFLLLLQFYTKIIGIMRIRVKYIILASVIGWLGPHGMYVLILGIKKLYPISNLCIGIYPFIIAYAIAKHRLMDVKVAITRSAILLIVYICIVGFPLLVIGVGKEYLQNSFGNKWFYPPLALYTLLALFAPYIYLTLQTRAEQKRIRQQIHLHQSLKAASKTTIEVQSIDKLAKIIPRYLIRLYSRLDNKISHITLFLKDKKKEEYHLRSSVGNQKLQSDILINSDSYLAKWFTKVREVLVENGAVKAKEVEVLVYEDIDFWMNKASILSVPYKGLNKVLNNLKKEMKELKASVILPSVYQKELLGFLILGEKTPDPYSLNDIDTFSILANDSAMAFKAAQLFEDLKIAQARLIQSEKLNLLGQLASSMAHEINNPLAIISGNVQLLLMDESDESKMKLLTKINDQTERGYKIIHRLLNFSKLPKEDIKEIDINRLVDETLELINHKIVHGNIELQKDFKATDIIRGNPTQIQEVILNLCVNAIQAMPQGGKLMINTSRAGDMVQIEVKDTGKGIPPEEVKDIFDPFFTKGKENGTGLGLFVASQIMSLHNGLIKVKSKVGEGTSFVLKFALGDEGPKGTESGVRS
ncbi:MAG: ATP-binding protein [Candidatus Omnitrophota bacterium]